ncbi:GTP cyclohydrolase FolE2 [Marinobacterium weihaiense]|uniref:GTP cyclohydrolase FolE2 n=1 Tax=Marinobacterium weihaiense TaxID=2851016 RepID=A0ABS6M9J0_9GAMM|nr:GTP cyclohydrolase FolE2 [Marinobacterium weihaiense]MBV0932945.1 GTP cyclohydrolase I FolE2 [Marinobacterium weihaiense]
MTTPTTTLPDVALNTRASHTLTLDWVGMSGIGLPLQLNTDTPFILPAKADIHVDIHASEHRGIHMSRLYLALQEQLQGQPLTGAGITALLDTALARHAGISQHAGIRLQFDLPVQRDALTSTHRGWKHYPAQVHGRLGPEGFCLECRVTLPYSSTCPCSAALSRQLIEQAFSRDFGGADAIPTEQVSRWLQEHASLATPHSQRSSAHLKVQLSNDFTGELPFLRLIDEAETALQTAVQTAVKREDEQAFAALNGENQMFCEDAARRLKQALLDNPLWQDFHVRVEHHESLHPHDAIAVCVKGVPGGYSANLFG